MKTTIFNTGNAHTGRNLLCKGKKIIKKYVSCQQPIENYGIAGVSAAPQWGPMQ
jgi:hypothetical protein